jgi:succinyl-CoA synthetase alpha subunit
VITSSPFPAADTPVVVVGGTGRYGRAQIAGMLTAGTRIVASVAPGRGATSIDGIPTFDTVAEAVAARGARAAVIYTPPAGVRDAVVECAEAGIRLAVAAAEFVPIHDTMSALATARAHDMWVVGPNTLGFAIPGQILLGSIPPEFTKPGPVALFGRSGTLTATTARLLTGQRIGQSLVAHIGGDTLCGRNPHEYLRVAAADPATELVVYLGEIGGAKEYAMLDLVRSLGKPLLVLVVGRHARPGRRMGHAGALIEGERGTAQAKLAALREAGAYVADDVLALPHRVKQLLEGSSRRCA